jgi:hypothetical protein
LQISGDADLYITTRLKTDTTVTLPSKTVYKWRSMNTAADSLSISYEDPKFCFDCEYIIGVEGFRNSTYTLLATANKASVVRLSASRPQTMSIDESGGVQYFSTAFLSSVADMTVSLTPLNTGGYIIHTHTRETLLYFVANFSIAVLITPQAMRTCTSGCTTARPTTAPTGAT